MVINEKLEVIRFDGGTLVLDFINTVHDRTKDPAPDYLYTPADLLYWGKRVSLINNSEYKTITWWIESDPNSAGQHFSNALLLRECLYQIFASVAQKKKPTSEDMAFFNAHLSSYFSFLKVDATRNKFTEGWDFPAQGFERILAPIVRDAHHLMLMGKQDKIRECPNCGWLFLDTSRNGKRRWCSMQTCGSIVKSLDYYYRKKENVKH